jgi:glutaredoxin
MYTRQGCHLCEAAWELLEDAQRRHGFSLEKVDIDTDPALVAEHGLHVPVVSVNGRVRFRGVVNAVLLRRLFDAEE